MPVNLIDPTVTPVGAGLPASPLAGMFGKAVNAYGSTFPNALDRSQIQYHNVETQRLQQQMGSGNQIADTVARALAANGPTTTQEPVSPQNSGMGPVPGPDLGVTTPVAHAGMSTGDAMRAALPDLIRGAANSGDVGKANALGLLVASYMKGTPGDIANQSPGQPTTEDMAMMSAGHPFAATPGGVLQERTLGTPEMRNRNFKIQQIMANNPGVTQQQATNIADGISEVSTDNFGNRVLTDKTGGPSKLLYSPGMASAGENPNGVTLPGGTPNTVQPPSTPQTPGAPPVAGEKPLNNPFNLRLVGATTGFRQFSTPEQGMLAGLNDLSVKLSGQSQAMSGKTPTVRNIISAYSPPNENATQQLIANAAARMKVDPDQPLNMTHLMPLAEAVLQQEQGGTGSAPPAARAAAPVVAPASFKMAPGDLGLPFDTMYGGPAVAGRAAHTISSFVGDQSSDPALAAFGKLNTLKNGLVSAMSTMPGRASNEGMQKRLLEQFPETDSNLLETQNGVEQGGINPVDAETKFNQGIEQGAALFQQANEALKSPYLDPKTRDAYQTVKSTIQKTFLQTLPGGKYAEFMKLVGEAPPAGQPAAPSPGASNLDTLTAATTMPKYETVPGQPVISAADIAETAKANHMTNQQVIDKLREQGRVK